MGVYASIDLGGTKIAGALATEDGQVLAQRIIATESHAGPPAVLARIARLVEEKTEGRIKIEVFTGGTLYKAEPDSIQALQLGDLAFARVSASPVGNFVPAINGIQMPYLYKSGAHMWAVLNSEIGQNFLAEIEKAIQFYNQVLASTSIQHQILIDEALLVKEQYGK